MLTPTSARPTSVSVLASSTNREPGRSAPGFTTTLSSTPAAPRQVGENGRVPRKQGWRRWSERGSLVSYRRPRLWPLAWLQTAALMGNTLPPSTLASL